MLPESWMQLLAVAGKPEMALPAVWESLSMCCLTIQYFNWISILASGCSKGER